jgi:hypothetical protein
MAEGEDEALVIAVVEEIVDAVIAAGGAEQRAAE